MRAKFKLDSITRSKYTKDGEPQWSLKLSPVCDGSGENKKFWKWTPSGAIEINTVNESAVNSMELGAEYYVDFIKA